MNNPLHTRSYSWNQRRVFWLRLAIAIGVAAFAIAEARRP